MVEWLLALHSNRHCISPLLPLGRHKNEKFVLASYYYRTIFKFSHCQLNLKDSDFSQKEMRTHIRGILTVSCDLFPFWLMKSFGLALSQEMAYSDSLL